MLRSHVRQDRPAAAAPCSALLRPKPSLARGGFSPYSLWHAELTDGPLRVCAGCLSIASLGWKVTANISEMNTVRTSVYQELCAGLLKEIG